MLKTSEEILTDSDQEKEAALTRLRTSLQKFLEKQGYIECLESTGRKAKELESRYPDFLDYRLYHLLIGSTPSKKCSKFDFPGEDSIEKFIQSAVDGQGL